MARRPRRCAPARPGNRPGDHVIGDAHYPGSRSCGHYEGNMIHHMPVLAGQSFCLGDIVTQVGGHAARVCSAAEEGEGMSWGDVSAGAYMALATVDASGLPSGGETVPVYTYGARVESILDGGIAVGSPVGVDLRDSVDGGRVDRGAPVGMSDPVDPGTPFWQRVRAMSPEDVADPVRGRALLGTMVKILTPGHPPRAVSKSGDFGAVVIRPQG